MANDVDMRVTNDLQQALGDLSARLTQAGMERGDHNVQLCQHFIWKIEGTIRVNLDFGTLEQPDAIAQLVTGNNPGDREQTLLGMTGSGMTFTMAKVGEPTGRPTRVAAHHQPPEAQIRPASRGLVPGTPGDYIVSYDDN